MVEVFASQLKTAWSTLCSFCWSKKLYFETNNFFLKIFSVWKCSVFLIFMGWFLFLRNLILFTKVLLFVTFSCIQTNRTTFSVLTANNITRRILNRKQLIGPNAYKFLFRSNFTMENRPIKMQKSYTIQHKLLFTKTPGLDSHVWYIYIWCQWNSAYTTYDIV